MERNRAKRIATHYMPALVRQSRKVSTRSRGNQRTKAQSRRVCERLAGYPWQASMISSLGTLGALLGRSAKLPSSAGQMESRAALNAPPAAGMPTHARLWQATNPPRPFVKQNRRAPLRIKNIGRAATELDSIAKSCGRRGPAWRLPMSGQEATLTASRSTD